MNFESLYTNQPGTIRGPGGEIGKVGIFGELRSSDLSDDIDILFDYGANTNYDVTTASTGSSPALYQSAADPSILVIESSANGTRSVQSRQFLRYSPGHTALSGFTFASHTVQPTAIYFCLKRDGVIEVRTPINQVNLEDIDWTKLNIFEFSFAYYGVAPIVIQVLKPNTNYFIPVHIHNTQHGQTVTTHIGSPRLPIRMEVDSTGVSRCGLFDVGDGFYLEFVYPPGNIAVKSGSWQGGSMASRRAHVLREFHYNSKQTGIGTTLTNIATFRSKSEFLGRTNKIISTLRRFSWLAYGGSGLAEIFIIKNASFSGALTWSDYYVGNSVIEIAPRVAGGINDVTVAGGIAGLADAQYPQAGAGANPSTFSGNDVPSGGLPLEPANGTYTICARISTGTISVFTSINWEEDF